MLKVMGGKEGAPNIPGNTLEAARSAFEAVQGLAQAPWLRASLSRTRFLFKVSAALEGSGDRALAGQARLLDRLVLGEAYRLAISLWRAVYRAFLLALLALLGLLGQEEEAEERPGVKAAREERPPPKPIIALITPKVISPTAGPNAA